MALCRLVIRRRRRKVVDTPHRQTEEVDPTRYTAPHAPKNQPAAASTTTATAAGAKQHKPQQQRSQAQHRAGARVDPAKAHYDTPRAQRQTATAPGHGTSTSSHAPRQMQAAMEKRGVEISLEKDVYEALEPDKESIYEETF